jgi:flagellar biosynthesis anti-sigma factor FlgM
VKVDLNGHNGSTLSSVTSPQHEMPGTAPVSPTDIDPQIGEDRTTLSGDSVTALAARALAAGETRQDKVEALRQAIQNGEYRIEPSKIAEAMIRQSE